MRRTVSLGPVVLLAAILVLFAGAFAPGAGAAQSVGEAIVKVYAVYDSPDYYNPWSMEGPRSMTGSGSIIEGNYILTNAHVVSDVTFLQVRRHGETQRYQARVVAVSHTADLALVEVEDPEFSEGVEPLQLGDLPGPQQEVLVYGFPLGGDTLSVTKGVISRIEHQPYVHSSAPLLAGQIDAPINPGNSGGPVIVDGKIVGVVMQGIPQAQNIGYMVPTPIIRHFLEDISDGRHDDFPSLGIVMQNMENPNLRKYYKLPHGQTGVLITQVFPGSPSDGTIRPGDVLLSADGFPVASDGTVEFRPKERTDLAYVFQRRQVGERVPLKVLRDGQVLSLEVILHRSMNRNWLVPMEQYETPPSYYIYGGIVFSPLSKNLLLLWGNDWYRSAPKKLVSFLDNNVPEVDGQQVVIVLRILAADINDGYQDMVFSIIKKVNGEKVLNMADLVRLIEENTADPYTVFETEDGQQIVLDAYEARKSRDRILATYKIREDRSEDLRK
ncbi:MAG: trypsin-like peptidase domain-containing protein [Bacillota bacterium]